MLLKIREKSQGVFAWIILLLICVPFALWGIQNYIGGGSETAIATVGDKEFFQDDVNRAYAQFSQNLQGMNFDEKVMKKQALDKLIKDEVLLQYVEDEGLVVTDTAARDFIKGLEYFQTDGKFNKKQYQSLLASQRMSSPEFVNRIKKALLMEQFQRSVVESSFTTDKEIEAFFKIQNQRRDADVAVVAIEKVNETPSEEEVLAYYQQHENEFLSEEQVAVEYVELALDDLAAQIEPDAEKLEAYYEEQKDLYTSKERRKISHILFAFTKDSDDDQTQLERALAAKKALAEKDFAELAAEISDDKFTAAKGGDLGLFNVGVMEKAFEDVASSLQLNEISEPVKSAFGYHLIKVTELVPGSIKSFDEVKQELTLAYQKAEAESKFYELGETLTEVSYESPDSLQEVAEAIGVEIQKTALFPKTVATDADKTAFVAQEAIINSAFSEDVLKGNNSSVIELAADRVVVLRILEHQPAEAKALAEVNISIVNKLLDDKARKLAIDKAEAIKQAVMAGQDLTAAAKQYDIEVKKYTELTRSSGELPWQVNQAIFKAAKPVDGKAVVSMVADAEGAQSVISLLAVKEGVMTESDKAQKKLAAMNLAKAFGQADFNATLSNLQNNADIVVNIVE